MGVARACAQDERVVRRAFAYTRHTVAVAPAGTREADMNTFKPLLVVALLAAGAQPDESQRRNTATRPAAGRSGMVSAGHPLATQAGLDTLAAGGNAFDAAVAVAVALNVVEPMMSGVGGYGTIVVYDAAKREARFLNCSGRMPAALDSDAFRPPTPNYQQNRRGAKAVSTPGNLNAWEAMSRTYGKLPWPRLFERGIALANDGFVLSEHTAGRIRSSFAAFPAHAQAIYGRNGQPLAAGDRLVQKDLARSLLRIADGGAKVVHGGELGQ